MIKNHITDDAQTEKVPPFPAALEKTFEDHYWDSFQADRELILQHVRAVLREYQICTAMARAAQPPAAPVETDAPAWHGVQDAIDAWAQKTLGEDAGVIMSWSDRLAQHLAPDLPRLSAGWLHLRAKRVLSVDRGQTTVLCDRDIPTELLVLVDVSDAREDALEAQGTIEQLEKQLAYERKKQR